jgi:ribosomal protein S27E
MVKRKYQNEDELADGYADVECPECEAIINVHFQKGRNSRRLRCPICTKQIIVNLTKEPFPQNLVQLQ